MNTNPTNIRVDEKTLNILVNDDVFNPDNHEVEMMQTNFPNKYGDRIVLKHLMTNYGHSFTQAFKHYTRKATIVAAIDYVKTYFKK